MEQTEVTASPTSIALISNKHEEVVIIDEKLCIAGETTGSGEVGVVDELGQLHGTGRVGLLTQRNYTL